MEWCTGTENINHAYRTGLIPKGERKTGSIPIEKVKQILELLEQGNNTYASISKATSVSPCVVAKIHKGEHWSDMSDGYDLSNAHPDFNRLSDEKVIEICELLQSGKYSVGEIQRMANIKTKSTICSIKNREYYNSISKDYDFSKVPKREKSQLVRWICELYENGKTNKEVMEITGLSRGLVESVKCGYHKEITKEYNLPILRKNSSVSDIHIICALLQAGYRNSEIVKLTGKPLGVIERIKYRRSHNDISKNYVW